MKTFIVITILIIFNACQGRNMPMQTNTSSNKHTLTSLPIIHKPVKTIHKTKKNKKSRKHKFYEKKKKTIIRPPSIASTYSGHTISHKKVFLKPNLPSLPYIPSINKSKLFTSEEKIHKKVIVDTIINTQVAKPRESFSGGGIVSNLDMATIRIGKSSDYTSIIFDSYQYEGKKDIPSKKAYSSGTYLFTYEPSKKRIIGLIDGYKAFSALLSDQHALFSDNTIVKNIYIIKHLGNDGIKFVIKLRKNVRVNIFDVKNPGRIIVNLFPL